MSDLAALTQALLDALRSVAPRFGLRGDVRAAYVPNPGNFVNASFTVTDGRVKRHVKLSPERDELDRWFGLRELLRDRYRAPEILGRLDVGDLHGLVFVHVSGAVPTDALLPEIVRLAESLHADRDLASRLADDPSPTYRSCYFRGIFECLSEDLVSVKADPAVRGLLAPEDLRFADAEVERLRRLGEERLPAEPVKGAIHGDFWLQNVLASDGGWYLLDWDDVRVGDLAGEYASLLRAPTGRGIDASCLLPPDVDLRDRFGLLLRAYCFDEIVDPLSDLTMIPAGLANRVEVWRTRARRSEVALARYRHTYR